MFRENWSIVGSLPVRGGQSGGGGVAATKNTQDTQVTATWLGTGRRVQPSTRTSTAGRCSALVWITSDLTGSKVSGNTGGGYDGAARPVAYGAVALASGNQSVTIADNTFTECHGTWRGWRAGWALYIDATEGLQIRANHRFLGNIGGVANGSVGGALVLNTSAPCRSKATHDCNRAAGAVDAQFALGGAGHQHQQRPANCQQCAGVQYGKLRQRSAAGGQPALPAGA